MRHLFVINPAAGKRDRTAALLGQIEAAFSGREERPVIVLTRKPGHAEEIARRAAGDGIPTVLYVCGGDGTLNEAVGPLVGQPQMVLAPIPIGTGNDFVRSLGWKGNSLPSLSSLQKGSVESIDLLRAADRVALNVVSFGLDAAVAWGAADFKRLPLVGGEGAYLLSAVRCLMGPLYGRCRLVADGIPCEEGEYLFVVAANGRYYGGGFCAAPFAELSDGLIDLLFVPAVPRWRLAAMIGAYRRGEHLRRYPFVHLHRCRSVQIFSDHPLDLNLDGEKVPTVNPTVEILPGALRLLIPEACCLPASRIKSRTM